MKPRDLLDRAFRNELTPELSCHSRRLTLPLQTISIQMSFLNEGFSNGIRPKQSTGLLGNVVAGTKREADHP